MSLAATPLPGPAHSLPVIRGRDFIVVDGANLDDAISFAAELLLDDVYELRSRAQPERMSLITQGGTHFQVAEGSEIGRIGADLHLDCALTFMSPDGQTSDALVFVQVDDAGHVEDIFLLPLVPLAVSAPMTLIGINTDTAAQTLAQVACVSFSRGTHITLASGEQRPIEALKVGDRVLTRDDGPQDVRWIGQSTVRAVGEFAPIRIAAGTLNNEHDLIVSPDHRLFIYQRSDALGAGRSELLIKARHLVNGDSVRVLDGGFVDYFQLLFDHHQIIYAEGIAAESMLIDSRTKPVLPEGLSAQHLGDAHAGLDVNEELLNHPDVAAILKKASMR